MQGKNYKMVKMVRFTNGFQGKLERKMDGTTNHSSTGFYKLDIFKRSWKCHCEEIRDTKTYISQNLTKRIIKCKILLLT